MPTLNATSATVCFVAFVGVALAMCIFFSPPKENYVGWNGALSPLVKHYGDALAECERADATLFQGEPSCMGWVNSQYSLTRDTNAPLLPRKTSLTEATKHCGANRECISDFFSQQEMMKYCAQHCQWKPHSVTSEECKQDCFKTLTPYMSTIKGWTYR